MGEVHRATDANLKRAVALKVLPGSVACDADRLARFRREAEVLAALSRQNIAHIHGLETSVPSIPGDSQGRPEPGRAAAAPEQAKGKAVDKRTDIWAFGVVLHEMLTGRHLFKAETVPETLAHVITRQVDLGALPDQTPRRVRKLLARCLERDPKQRFRDIGEARIILGGADEGPSVKPPQARPPGATLRPVLGAVALAAAGCAAGFGVASVVTGPEPGRAVSPALTMTPIATSGHVISAAVSPDGRCLAYVQSEQGRQSLWLQQVAGGQTLRLIPDQNAEYWSQTFTPDGNNIVFGLKSRDDPEGALCSVSTLGGVPTLIPRLTSVRAVYAKFRRTSAVLADGSIRTWGSVPVFGKPGPGDKGLSPIPIELVLEGLGR